MCGSQIPSKYILRAPCKAPEYTLLLIWFWALQGPEYAKTHHFLMILGALQGALKSYYL